MKKNKNKKSPLASSKKKKPSTRLVGMGLGAPKKPKDYIGVEIKDDRITYSGAYPSKSLIEKRSRPVRPKIGQEALIRYLNKFEKQSKIESRKSNASSNTIKSRGGYSNTVTNRVAKKKGEISQKSWKALSKDEATFHLSAIFEELPDTDSARVTAYAYFLKRCREIEDLSALPRSAPELYENRDNKRESAPEFLRKVYGRYIDKGLTKQHIGDLDSKLYKAISVWPTNNKKPFPSDVDLPTKADLNAKKLEALGDFKPEELARELVNITFAARRNTEPS